MGIVGSEAKETRMGAIAAPGPGPAASGQSYAYQEGAIQAPAAEAAAPKGKLNWKHYTAAGAIASVGLVASVVLFAMVLMRKPVQPDRNPLVAPPQDAQQQQIAQPQGGQINQPGAQIVPSPDLPAADKAKRGDKGAGTPGDTSKPGTDTATDQLPPVPGPSVEPSKPRETHAQVPVVPRDKPGSDGKRASADDNKEKKGKLGGLFKKIGGVFKGDDKDKDKKQH